jgi:hypothetical protein
MSGDEPFYVLHGPYEHETMKAPPAQPPAYDIAFILRADERVMWPVEAKIIETPKAVAQYIRDIRQEFLTCRYAPFSSSGAMLGYLLSGAESDALGTISDRLGCSLEEVFEHPGKPNRWSLHKRTVPAGKCYPVDFKCYHVILAYQHLSRTR